MKVLGVSTASTLRRAVIFDVKRHLPSNGIAVLLAAESSTTFYDSTNGYNSNSTVTAAAS